MLRIRFWTAFWLIQWRLVWRPWLGWLSHYSDSVTGSTTRESESIPGSGGDFSVHSGQTGSGPQTSLLPNEYRRAVYHGVTRSFREVDHSPECSAEVKEYVEVYLHDNILCTTYCASISTRSAHNAGAVQTGRQCGVKSMLAAVGLHETDFPFVCGSVLREWKLQSWVTYIRVELMCTVVYDTV